MLIQVVQSENLHDTVVFLQLSLSRRLVTWASKQQQKASCWLPAVGIQGTCNINLIRKINESSNPVISNTKPLSGIFLYLYS